MKQENEDLQSWREFCRFSRSQARRSLFLFGQGRLGGSTTPGRSETVGNLYLTSGLVKLLFTR